MDSKEVTIKDRNSKFSSYWQRVVAGSNAIPDYGDIYGAYCAGYAAALKWTRITEGFPKNDGFYLVTFADGNVTQAYYRSQSLLFTAGPLSLDRLTTVTAWMPKPPPFDGGKG